MADLFDPRPKTPEQMTRRTDPATSLEAAGRVANTLGPIQQKVYDAFDAAGPAGMTDFDLEETLGSHGSTYRSRRAELVEAKLIVNSGRKKEQAGGKRIVWVAAKHAP